MVKNMPADAGDTGDMGSIPDMGKTPRATEQLNFCATTVALVLSGSGTAATASQLRKPTCLERVLDEKPLHRKAHGPQLESGPPLTATREKPLRQQRSRPATK